MARLGVLLLTVAMVTVAVALPLDKNNKSTKENNKKTDDVLSNEKNESLELLDTVSAINTCKTKTIASEPNNPLLRNGYTDTNNLWPNKQVPYVLSTGFTAAQKATIVRGFDVFGKWTCLKMVPRTTEVNYLMVKSNDTDGCWANGRFLNKGEQLMNLQPNGCVYEEYAFHEAMHVIGFDHEQNRHDRDLNIIYNLDLIEVFPDYSIEKKYDNSAWGVPYDYFSVMHYGQQIINGKLLITPTRDMQGKPFGSGGKVFSWSDVRRVNRMYSCDASFEQAIDKQEYLV